MQKIDLAVWPRAELFRFFSAVSQPFYSVTFRVDVTNLHAYARAHGVSFYYALGYLVGQCMKASKGKANPGIVKEIVTKMLSE